MAARLLAVVSLEGSVRLANGDNLNCKFSICWILISWCFSVFEISRASGPELLNVSMSRNEHVLVRIRVSDGLLNTAVRRCRRFGSAGEGLVGVVRAV